MLCVVLMTFLGVWLLFSLFFFFFSFLFNTVELLARYLVSELNDR